MANLTLPKNIDKTKIQQFTKYYELIKLNDKKLSTINPQLLLCNKVKKPSSCI
ncbi:MAG: hypothetical protein O7C60_09090 [Rickettsia endosymbiont of Ixodes persulcatus]|nr:hypothetical protein [Rickettsia endosymbiont of Ixodes persulcatus]